MRQATCEKNTQNKLGGNLVFNYALVSNKNFNHRQVELIQKQVLSYILAIKRLIVGKFRVNTKFVLQIKN